jgi:hypothetical protein
MTTQQKMKQAADEIYMRVICGLPTTAQDRKFLKSWLNISAPKSINGGKRQNRTAKQKA